MRWTKDWVQFDWIVWAVWIMNLPMNCLAVKVLIIILSIPSKSVQIPFAYIIWARIICKSCKHFTDLIRYTYLPREIQVNGMNPSQSFTPFRSEYALRTATKLSEAGISFEKVQGRSYCESLRRHQFWA